MKILTISYRRTKNLGDYNSETLEETAQVEESDLAGEAFYELRAFVLAHLELPTKNQTSDDEDIPY